MLTWNVNRHDLRNIVNRHDISRVRRKLLKGEVGALVAKARGSSRDRVIRQWNESTVLEPTQWWVAPAVRRRWNLLVTGDENLDFPAHVAARYLNGRHGMRALSLGCGTGGRELRWAELGVFDQIDAFDIASATVEAARAKARAANLADRVNFAVRDFRDLDTGDRYDVVLAEHSLHHLAPMPEVVGRIRELLAPDGLFVVDEYVGPRRFQWTDRQLREAQGVLDSFPEQYRRMGSTGLKKQVIRPSILFMLMTDPSEAVDSSRIAEALHSQLDVLEERPYGGAVLHLALSDIAQNFADDEQTARDLLAAAFQVEDRLMAEGVVGSDFATFVCRERVGRTA